MDEEISIIDTKTRNEKIKKFFVKNKFRLLYGVFILIFTIIGFYSFEIYKNQQIKMLSEKFNNAVIEYKNGKSAKTILSLKEVINSRNSTYSPLALYFLIDNNLVENKDEINELFDVIIEKTSLETEIKYLIIYKKALYNADTSNENELLNILNPLLNSKSVWRSHALYLMAEYFYSLNEIQKSREFFNKILSIKNANQDILKEVQKRLNRDLSE
tara:strand:+ start:643 stop:1287 length:645 start_codon:yes stop_codon:yes gene_type:complete